MDVTGLATFKFLIFLMQCQPPVLVVRFFGSKCAGITWRLLLELFQMKLGHVL